MNILQIIEQQKLEDQFNAILNTIDDALSINNKCLNDDTNKLERMYITGRINALKQLKTTLINNKLK